MSEALPSVSLRRVCRVLGVVRSGLYAAPPGARSRSVRDRGSEAVLVARLRELARLNPTFGYRQLWALLRHGDGLRVNHKKIHRLVKQLELQVRRRQVTPRPRVKKAKSRTARSNERWAMGDGRHPYLLRQRRLGASDGRH